MRALDKCIHNYIWYDLVLNKCTVNICEWYWYNPHANIEIAFPHMQTVNTFWLKKRERERVETQTTNHCAQTADEMTAATVENDKNVNNDKKDDEKSVNENKDDDSNDETKKDSKKTDKSVIQYVEIYIKPSIDLPSLCIFIAN